MQDAARRGLEPPILAPTKDVKLRHQPEQESLRINTQGAVQAATSTYSQPPPRIDPRQNEHYKPQVDAARGDRTSGMDQYARRPFQAYLSPTKLASPRPLTPPKTSTRNNQLYPPNGSSRRAPSPTSSMSSMQRSATSSVVEHEASPVSSRSTQPANAASIKKAKPKLNLLNPVSLLRRRRTAQNVESNPEGLGIGHVGLDVPAMNVPEDYDPRIKGKGVHDFNNPQPRRNYSTNDVKSMSKHNVGDASPVEEYHGRSLIPDLPDSAGLEMPSRKPKHSPDHSRAAVFREHFEDEASTADPATSGVQRESLADPSFLARISQQLDFDSRDFSPFSPARSPRQIQTTSVAGERISKSTNGGPSVRNSSDQSTVRSSFSQDTKATSPPSSPSPKRSRASLDAPFDSTAPAIPKHLTSSDSKASRFSFQFNSDGTIAEEKALEEKGKQKAAEKSGSESNRNSRYDDLDDEEEDEFDDFADGPHEEEIPMLGADDGLDNNNSKSHLNLAPADESTWNSSNSSQPTIVPLSGSKHTTDGHSEQVGAFHPGRHSTVKSSGSGGWYFDDGTFNEPAPNEQRLVDENMFDSPNDEKFERTALNKALAEARTNQTTSPDRPQEGFAASQSESDQAYHDNTLLNRPQLDQSRLSTQNLETLNSTLASIQRQPSAATSTSESDHGWYGQWNQNNLGSNMRTPYEDDTDYDALEDDPMIAEANAEVLASEDADFYGSEFGFYGAAASKGGEISNGGYWGAPGGMMRSKSGRMVAREPNLTPITERSEYSRRTSYVSLHHLGSAYSIGSNGPPGSAHHLPGPGLRDIAADIVAGEHEELGLAQLMHMRKATFGVGRGSSASTSPSVASGSPVMQNFSPQSREPPAQYSESQHEDPSGYKAEERTLPKSYRSPDHEPELQRVVSPASISPVESSSSSPQRSSNSRRQPTQMNSNDTSPRLYLNYRSDQIAPTSPTPKTGCKSNAHADISGSYVMPTQPAQSLPSQSTSSIPSLPSHLLAKFASRPPASSASYLEREREAERAKMYQDFSSAIPLGRTVTSYEKIDGRTYLMKYRKLSNGDYQFLGKELSNEGAAPFD